MKWRLSPAENATITLVIIYIFSGMEMGDFMSKKSRGIKAVVEFQPKIQLIGSMMDSMPGNMKWPMLNF